MEKITNKNILDIIFTEEELKVCNLIKRNNYYIFINNIYDKKKSNKNHIEITLKS